MARRIRIIRSPRSAAKPVPLSKILEGPLQARYWSKVQKGAPDDCWTFTGACTSTGYGVVNIRLARGQYRKVRAHVFALMSHTGEVNNRDVLHSLKCTTKLCVNPHHLRWGDKRQNGLDERDLGRVPGQKLTWDQVDQIREMLEAGYPQTGIGILFGIDQTTVSNIKRQKIWKPETRRQAA